MTAVCAWTAALALSGLLVACGGPPPGPGGGGGDTTPPTVLATRPEDGASDVPLEATLAVTFSEAMDAAATAEALALTPAVACDVAWGVGGTVLSCDPQEALRANRAYAVTIGTGARDTAGNALTAPFRYGFTTGTDARPVCAFDISAFDSCVFGL
ncbi:MAG: Ig-like domain-containing protein [Trueperaceae bacterium]|nr:Ig-like domain-containing protein [Trueperaceae bacterium]